MNIKFGNWNDRESWGFEAERLMDLGSKCSEDIVSYELPPIANGILAFYPSYHNDRIAKMANRLVRAIYRVGVLPPECWEAVRKSPVFWQDLLYLLTNFGEYSVVLPDETPVPEGSIIIKPSTGDIFFAKNNVGMPVKEFLFWYTNFIYKVRASAVLQEWSGIPEEQLRRAYMEILEVFRNEIEHNYRLNR